MLHKPMAHTPDYPAYVKNSSSRFIHIAPAPEREMTLTPEEPRKYNYKSNSQVVQTASIARRNARERNRVKQVNDSYNNLRKKLPAAVIAALAGGSRRGSGKKLSKVDTLRMVVEYIRYLENIIDESDMPYDANRKNLSMDTSFTDALSENGDGKYGERESPFSCSVASPVGSESSSGVSSAYLSDKGYIHHGFQLEDERSPLDHDELFNSMSWWDGK